MIIERIESLILERGMEDALKRAFSFTAAGADGIMLHSRKGNPAEIFEFCDQLMWADFPAMQKTAEETLKAFRAKEEDSELMPFKDIIRLIDELWVVSSNL